MMFLRTYFLSFISLTIPCFLTAQSGVDITFIANDGFLLTDGSRKVLVDAIFSEGSGTFTTPPAAVLTEERNATTPFNSVDFLLSTHHHADHINARYVAEHMVNDNGSMLLCPLQVYDSMAATDAFATIDDRIVPLLPDVAEKIDTLINGYDLRIVSLIHYNNMVTIQNLGYIFSLGDITIFHPGDGFLNDTTEIKNLNLASDSIDLLFLSYRVLNNDFDNLGRKVIQYINPKAVIVMHIPINQAEHYSDLVTGLQNMPPFYVMEEQMSELTFILSGDSLRIENNVGITQIADSPVKIFPNPSKDGITIRLNHVSPVTTQVELLDLFGKSMSETSILPEVEEVSLNLDNYSKGIYMVRVFADRIPFCSLICRD
jgi:L-ascorbate metabolism protein UlaG (beta-lactamase superfamily)